MTAALLASLVGDGVLALDDEIGRWLDAGPNGNITLEQLATHTSGLPRLAPNQPTGEANPYRDFTAERAQEGLRTVDPRRTPGTCTRTSGTSCSARAGAGQRSALPGPADGTAARAARDDPLRRRRGGRRHPADRARGGKPAGHWDFALPGPGAVEATIGDLARYLAACLAPPDGPLGTAIRLCQQPRVRIGGQADGRARLDRHRRAALPQRRNRRVLRVHDDRPGGRARHGRAGEHAWQLGSAARRCRHGGRQGQRPAPGPAAGHRGVGGARVGRASQGTGAGTARRRLCRRPARCCARRTSRS